MKVSIPHGVQAHANVAALTDSIKADHGFNMDSKSVRNLLQTMSELTAQQRRDFLQFVTGSPKLPIGGTYLHLPRWIVLTTSRFQESNADIHGCLPSQRATIHA